MSFFLYDSLEKNKREFIPLDPKNIRVYACGPTVYNYAHVGNARMAVVCDLLVVFQDTPIFQRHQFARQTSNGLQICNSSLRLKPLS